MQKAGCPFTVMQTGTLEKGCNELRDLQVPEYKHYRTHSELKNIIKTHIYAN